MRSCESKLENVNIVIFNLFIIVYYKSIKKTDDQTLKYRHTTCAFVWEHNSILHERLKQTNDGLWDWDPIKKLERLNFEGMLERICFQGSLHKILSKNSIPLCA